MIVSKAVRVAQGYNWLIVSWQKLDWVKAGGLRLGSLAQGT